jgi:hypothetical protein
MLKIVNIQFVLGSNQLRDTSNVGDGSEVHQAKEKGKRYHIFNASEKLDFLNLLTFFVLF